MMIEGSVSVAGSVSRPIPLTNRRIRKAQKYVDPVDPDLVDLDLDLNPDYWGFGSYQIIWIHPSPQLSL
jgi:hypothetical protein